MKMNHFPILIFVKYNSEIIYSKNIYIYIYIKHKNENMVHTHTFVNFRFFLILVYGKIIFSQDVPIYFLIFFEVFGIIKAINTGFQGLGNQEIIKMSSLDF